MAIDLEEIKADSNLKLITASKEGDIETIKSLIDLSSDLGPSVHFKSEALRIATENGHDKIVKLLLKEAETKNKVSSMITIGR